MEHYTEHRFVICIRNDEYPASLETRKIYEAIPDQEAEKHHQLRIIDESGEDYFYPEEYFVHIELSKAAEEALVKAA
ncbi:hypothetical protein [Thiohalophilus sp.]|uniref:hypothetical protein n=1 Tax=Thiohalophilus sp. TaxID=3028392 RepID=UPI002ACD7E3D|nr:hypothetical protein [Thiohalophilus sp.]MDZ7663586.1 hypothetical protein [Thiohalophilus sp.]